MAKTPRTLVVDDDKGIRFFLDSALQRAGHNVTTVTSGEEALEMLRNTPFDLAILDLELGGRVDGLRVLEAVKWRWPDTATIILTGHASLDSALSAIQEGVDGYLLKPAGAKEVRQAASEALERRRGLARPLGESAQSDLLQRGPFAVDLEKRLVTNDGTSLDLTNSEFELLVHLMQNAHRVVPSPELVWVVQRYKCEDLREARDIIKWYIHRLRCKVESNPSRPCHILNVRGTGYTFKE
ncbi:MAG TPA: response regulator transcription factor [Anaerolineae bacterium]|nr:response regulator transcription factor [Anaerolineae bacterium]